MQKEAGRLSCISSGRKGWMGEGMSAAVNFVGELLITSLEISVLFLLLLGAARWLDRYFPYRFRKWCWLLLGLRLLVPFRLRLPGGISVLGKLSEWEAAVWMSRAAVLFLTVWAAGVLLVLAAGLSHYRRFQAQVLDTAQEITDEALLRQFNQVREELLLPRPVKLYRSSQIRTPMAVGVFHTVLLLPGRPYSPEELRLVFCHEGMHIDHLDVLYKLALAAAAALHWFNPLVWRLKKLAFRDLEMVCDMHVTEDMDREGRGFYAGTILDCAGQETKRDLACSTCFYGSREILKERLDQIMETEKKKQGTPVLLSAVLLLLLLEGLLPARPVLREQEPERAVQVEFLNGTGTVSEE